MKIAISSFKIKEVFLLKREAERAGPGSQPVTPDQDSSRPDDVARQITDMTTEDGPFNDRPLILGGRTQPPIDKQPTIEERDKRGRPGPDSHMGD